MTFVVAMIRVGGMPVAWRAGHGAIAAFGWPVFLGRGLAAWAVKHMGEDRGNG